MHNALGNTLKSFSDQVLLIDFLSQTNKKPFCLVATGAPVDGAGCSYYPTFWSNISFHGCDLNLPSGFEISGQSMAPTCESLATIYAHGKTFNCTTSSIYVTYIVGDPCGIMVESGTLEVSGTR